MLQTCSAETEAQLQDRPRVCTSGSHRPQPGFSEGLRSSVRCQRGSRGAEPGLAAPGSRRGAAERDPWASQRTQVPTGTAPLRPAVARRLAPLLGPAAEAALLFQKKP